MAFHEQSLISKVALGYKLVKRISKWNFNQRSPLTLLFLCASMASRCWSPVEAQHSPQQQSTPCKASPVLWTTSTPAAAVLTYTSQHQHLLEWGKHTKQEMECFLPEIKKKGNLLLVKHLQMTFSLLKFAGWVGVDVQWACLLHAVLFSSQTLLKTGKHSFSTWGICNFDIKHIECNGQEDYFTVNHSRFFTRYTKQAPLPKWG